MTSAPNQQRTRRGWLRAEQLMAGLQEQHAVMIDGTKHVITLRHHAQDDTFRVNHTTDAPGQEFPEGIEWPFEARAISAAREKFTQLVCDISKQFGRKETPHAEAHT